ncbi:hypothetical protein ACFQZO_15195 [Bradyrhizobium sp. GCM10027634]|uniref:hypothetical protein n=1 Tax=unclassified Bradyrhizobium TaxID=2631580 RepID=UPI00188AB885|nr:MULTISPECIES: hypothetical protein [unclassified Bradyrhizobium]MDN5002231.1 hypothetical protein [Bradyrhizobium sp. WYCCWR 12677]
MITSRLAAGRWQMSPVPVLGNRIEQAGSKVAQARLIVTASRQWTNAKSSIIVVRLDRPSVEAPPNQMSKRRTARDDI